MPSALIAGLLPEQAHRVRLAMGKRYRLRFVQSAHTKSVKTVPEVAIVVTSYLNHGAIQRIQKLAPGEIHYIQGRDREVIACLENRLC